MTCPGGQLDENCCNFRASRQHSTNYGNFRVQSPLTCWVTGRKRRKLTENSQKQQRHRKSFSFQSCFSLIPHPSRNQQLAALFIMFSADIHALEEPVTIKTIVTSAWDFMNNSALSLLHTIHHPSKTHAEQGDDVRTAKGIDIRPSSNKVHQEAAFNSSSPPRAPSPVEPTTTDAQGDAEGSVEAESVNKYVHACSIRTSFFRLR